MRAAAAWVVCVMAAVGCSGPESTGTTGGTGGGGGSTSSGSSGGGGGSGGGSSSSGGGGNSSSLTITWPRECAASGGSSSSTGGAASGTSSSGPQLECVGHVCWGPPTLPTATITVTAVDYLGMTNEEGVSVVVCREGDIECANPIVSAETNSLGQVTLMVPLEATHGFAGHIQLTAPDRVPTIVQIFPPISGQTGNYTVGVFNEAQLDLVVRLAGADEVKPSRGHVGAIVEDCAKNNVAGVAFELDAMDEFSSSAYLVNNVPDSTASETDSTGAVGFFNVVPGITMIRARLVDEDLLIGQVPVLVREGWVTTLVVPPSPF